MKKPCSYCGSEHAEPACPGCGARATGIASPGVQLMLREKSRQTPMDSLEACPSAGESVVNDWDALFRVFLMIGLPATGLSIAFAFHPIQLLILVALLLGFAFTAVRSIP